MNIMVNSIFIGAALLVLLVVGVLVAICSYFYSIAIKRSPKDFLSSNQDLAPIQSDSKAASGAGNERAKEAEHAQIENLVLKWVENQSYETWTITSEDGLKLVACYIPAKTPSKKTVILAHGYASKGKEMGGFAAFYYEKLGFNVLMPDDRGHGASEGNYIGFGWPDRKDYLLWIQKVVEKVGDDGQIVLHGLSMGGATVMMVSGEALPEQVKVIVEDCGYTSVHDQLAYQLKRMYKLPKFPILYITSLLTKLKAGYSFDEASALNQVQKTKLPMLFIHGDEDTFVPTSMVWAVFEACTSEKDIYIVKGASHGMAYETDRAAYEHKVASFVGRYIQ